MTSYYRTPDGDVGIFWQRLQIKGKAVIKIRLFKDSRLHSYHPNDLTWCTRKGATKK